MPSSRLSLLLYGFMLAFSIPAATQHSLPPGPRKPHESDYQLDWLKRVAERRHIAVVLDGSITSKTLPQFGLAILEYR